jgi:hypothetical protein
LCPSVCQSAAAIPWRVAASACASLLPGPPRGFFAPSPAAPAGASNFPAASFAAAIAMATASRSYRRPAARHVHAAAGSAASSEPGETGLSPLLESESAPGPPSADCPGRNTV